MTLGNPFINTQEAPAAQPVKKAGRGGMIAALAVAALACAGGLALAFKGGAEVEEDEGEALPDNPPPAKKTPKKESDEERRKIMAELGRKGSEKSAEVRRAKKAAKEAQADDTPPVSA